MINDTGPDRSERPMSIAATAPETFGLGMFADLDNSRGVPYYRRGRRFARAMTAAHAAAAAGDGRFTTNFMALADALFGPLGDAGAEDLREFAAGVFREEEERAQYLLDRADSSEPPMSPAPPANGPAAAAFAAMGRIMSLMSHPGRRSQSGTLTRLLVQEVRQVEAVLSSLPSIYQLAVLEGLGASWPDLDGPGD